MKLLITGANGQLGEELQRLAGDFGFQPLARGSQALDISDAAQVDARVAESSPVAIINAAAYTAVDKAESEPERAYAVNRDGPGNLARAAQTLGIPLLHVSTDYVFDGSGERPWHEDDRPAPLGVYGASKVAGEEAVVRACQRYLILRTSWMFGVHGNNFVKTMLRLGAERERLGVVADQFGGPTPATDIARTLLTLAQRLVTQPTCPSGIYHYSGSPACSWHAFASEIFCQAQALGLLDKAPQLDAIGTADYPTPARRPANSRLSGEALLRDFAIAPPDWRQGLSEVLATLRAQRS